MSSVSKRKKTKASKTNEKSSKKARTSRSTQAVNAVVKKSSVSVGVSPHQNNRYGKEGERLTPNMEVVRTVSRFLSKIGVGGTTTIKDIEEYTERKIGRDRSPLIKSWLAYQSGKPRSSGETIKNPKVLLGANGKVKVLKLYQAVV